MILEFSAISMGNIKNYLDSMTTLLTLTVFIGLWEQLIDVL